MEAQALHVALDVGCRRHRAAIGTAQGRVLAEFDVADTAAGVTVRMSAAGISGPVIWLASGPVQIDGTVDLSGQQGLSGGDVLKDSMRNLRCLVPVAFREVAASWVPPGSDRRTVGPSHLGNPLKCHRFTHFLGLIGHRDGISAVKRRREAAAVRPACGRVGRVDVLETRSVPVPNRAEKGDCP